MKTVISHQWSVISTVMLAGVFSASGGGPQYAIPWSKVSGGGAMLSTGGPYTVSGTIGQHDAGARATGGDYSLTGGFWAFSVISIPGLPALNITLTGHVVTVSWPSPSTGFILQMSTGLATSPWTTPPETVNDNGTLKYILINDPTGHRFFRLMLQ